jgi:hypothetical protein
MLYCLYIVYTAGAMDPQKNSIPVQLALLPISKQKILLVASSISFRLLLEILEQTSSIGHCLHRGVSF